jgi:hypothetical protein
MVLDVRSGATSPLALDGAIRRGEDRFQLHPSDPVSKKEPEMKRKLHKFAAVVFAANAALAHAHSQGPSQVSELSALPVAMSVAAPAMMLSAGAMLTVVAVEAAGRGTVWVLERASDGARASVTLGAQAAGGVSLAVGTAVEVVAMGAGWVICTAGKAIAFIPNEVGAALLYNERLTR